jgi:hypothetical protein
VWESRAPRTALGPRTKRDQRSRRPGIRVAPKTLAPRNGIGLRDSMLPRTIR